MKKGIWRMKHKVIMAACVLLCISSLFCSCSDAKKEKTLYVYGIGIDSVKSGVRVSVLCSDGGTISEKTQNKSERNNESENKNESRAYFKLVEFEGANVKKAFVTFFDEYKNVFINTNEVYIISPKLKKESVKDLASYLSNTASVPIKSCALKKDDPYGFFLNCLSMTEDEYKELFLKEQTNVIKLILQSF